MGKEKVERTLLDWINNPPRPIVIAVFMVVIVLSLLVPLGLPVVVSPRTKGTYNYVETLSEDDVVLYVCNIGAGYHAEIGPSSGAVLTHLLRRGVKIVFVSTVPDGMMVFELGYDYGWQESPEDNGYVYGEDYVELGYLAGGETAMAKWASELHSAYPVDMHGTPLGNLPMMANINTADDFSFVYQADSGLDSCESMVRQWSTTYTHIKIAWSGSALQVSGQMAYYPDPAVGIIGGIRGAAEYEILIKRPARGAKFTDVLSTTQVYALVLLIGGNIAFLMKRMQGKGG